MQPTAFQPAVDLIPFGGQQVMVVGCGTTPLTHPGHPHLMPLPGGAHMGFLLAGTYSMDINNAMTPHRVGSFWIADHTEDLPGNQFTDIYFENLPAGLFANRGWCLVAARSAHRLLQHGGVVYVRSGLAALAPGGHLDGALQTVFGAANVQHHVDAFGLVMDIHAVK